MDATEGRWDRLSLPQLSVLSEDHHSLECVDVQPLSPPCETYRWSSRSRLTSSRPSVGRKVRILPGERKDGKERKGAEEEDDTWDPPPYQLNRHRILPREEKQPVSGVEGGQLSSFLIEGGDPDSAKS